MSTSTWRSSPAPEWVRGASSRPIARRCSHGQPRSRPHSTRPRSFASSRCSLGTEDNRTRHGIACDEYAVGLRDETHGGRAFPISTQRIRSLRPSTGVSRSRPSSICWAARSGSPAVRTLHFTLTTYAERQDVMGSLYAAYVMNRELFCSAASRTGRVSPRSICDTCRPARAHRAHRLPAAAGSRRAGARGARGLRRWREGRRAWRDCPASISRHCRRKRRSGKGVPQRRIDAASADNLTSGRGLVNGSR
jgi:hypothetical protein